MAGVEPAVRRRLKLTLVRNRALVLVIVHNCANMKTTIVLFLLGFFALALAETKHSGTMAPAASTNDAGTSKTPSPTTTTNATTTTNTTTTATTTSTTKSTTTTTATTPTTTKSTTTTTATTPTTTVPPTTTKPPTNTNSTLGNYTLDNGAQRCLMVQMELRIRLVSQKANGTFLLLPNKTSTAGDCNDTHAALTLRADGFNLTMWFGKNLTAKTTFVNRLAFNLTHDFSKKINAAVTYKVDNQSVHFFNAKTGQSYSCSKESLDMGQGLHLDIDQERIQAFNFTKSNDFGTPEPCKADQNNYRVAIAVGITLLVLVVVVVVAYLLARKKRSEGYQSL